MRKQKVKIQLSRKIVMHRFFSKSVTTKGIIRKRVGEYRNVGAEKDKVSIFVWKRDQMIKKKKNGEKRINGRRETNRQGRTSKDNDVYSLGSKQNEDGSLFYSRNYAFNVKRG